MNGDFVKGVESWASLSYMKTAEDLYADQYQEYYNASGEVIHNGGTDVAVDSATIYPGYIPRPTDQRITFGLFFQDYLPMNPTFKMNLGLYFGSGLPTGAHLYIHILTACRLTAGLILVYPNRSLAAKHCIPKSGFFKGFKNLWVTMEILNLLQISNTISYLGPRFQQQPIRGSQLLTPGKST
ncbi:MAG: hypothetical protein U0Z17_09330 [Bacteroidales bacterium]